MGRKAQLNFIPGYSAPRAWTRLNSFDALLALGALAVTAAFLWRSMGVLRHSWDWGMLLPYIVSYNAQGSLQAGMLLKGLGVTLRLGVWALLLALITGGLVGCLTAKQKGIAALPGVIYITVLRNTPPLVLLFLVYFFAGSFFAEPILHIEDVVASLPPWGRELTAALFAPPGHIDRMTAAVLTLGLYSGAYVAEIVRGAIEAIDNTQWDASASLGMNPWQQMYLVIAPEAFRLMLPPLTGQCISVFKETALASAISLPELTFQSLEVMAVTRMTFELWLATASMYLCLCGSLAYMGRWLEKKYSGHILTA